MKKDIEEYFESGDLLDYADKKNDKQSPTKEEKKASKVPVEQSISFKFLKAKGGLGDGVNNLDRDILAATGMTDMKDDSANRLNRIVQMTGG